jgi:hypothetical protein
VRSRWLLAVVALACAGCNSLQGPTTTLRGQERGRVDVVMVHTKTELPDRAWLVESDAEEAEGLVIFTKWGAGDYRYHERSYFVFEEAWRAGVNHIGIVKGSEFCTVNPEHGAYSDGDSYVITRAYDYCAGLVQD